MKSFSTIPILIVLLITSIFTFSFAQVDWTKSGDPVLEPGVSGEWDYGAVVAPHVIFEDTLYKMWYMGYDGAIWRIGYATSEDGLNWTKHVANPVLNVGDPGSWDDVEVFNPYVLFKDSLYHMWYTGNDGSTYRIGYATSMDGKSWTKYEGNPVLDIGPAGSWNERSVSQPCVRFDGNRYHMWFGGWAEALRSSIGYATSTDGITWTEYEANPVLEAGKDGWDNVQVSVPEVIFDGNTYHMWYNGQNTPAWFHWRTGYALSQDGINWIKYESNPVLAPSNGSWDSQAVGFPGLFLNEADSLFEMYYTGGAADWDGQIGYAKSQIRYDAFFEFESNSLSYHFTDKSIGIITDWLWKFGDGDSSTVRNPAHVYTQDGEYNVMLAISGPYGSDSLTQPIIISGLEEKTNDIPDKFMLFNNYPNPFNPSTTIEFTLPTSEYVELKVYNILGKEVKTLVSNKLNQGNHTYTFDGKNLASGIYYYQLIAGEYREVKKMILLR